MSDLETDAFERVAPPKKGESPEVEELNLLGRLLGKNGEGSVAILKAAREEITRLRGKPDIWEGLMQAADDIAERKGRDYTKGSPDRLANFKTSGADAGIRPLQAWLVFTKKHVDAVFNYVKTGGQSESEPIMGRFVDVINYMRLGWLLVLEEQRSKQSEKT